VPVIAVRSGRLPLTVRFERRLQVAPRRAALSRLLGLVAALLLVGILLAATGRHVFTLTADVIKATFGRQFGLEETAVLATPILLDAIAVAVALRMRLWNIGVEGQFYMGAWAATGVGIHLH